MCLILPDASKSSWREPSQSLPKDQMGNCDRTKFRVRARLHDGHVVWTGWFEDRDDAGAFLWAHVTGSLGNQPALWRLPTPYWVPGLWEDVLLEFATVTFLTSTGSNTWTVANDWNSAQNTIEVLGAGASGSAAGSINYAAGGGGGAYSKITNLSLTPNASASYTIGSGGASVSDSSTGVSGNAGGDTFFNGASLGAASVGAKGGSGGLCGVPATGGAGGVAASGIGATKYSGGAGINANGGTQYGCGGGAAGLNGAGGDATASQGGRGDNGSGGTGGLGALGTGGNGNAGTEWDGSHGSGGGGGGGGNGTTDGSFTGGSGGNYGGGGGAGAASGHGTGTSGAGIQGLIVITYTPQSAFGFNLAMLGM